MIISKLEEIDKGKIKVYIDNEFRFCLYQKDLKVYRLKENDMISDTIYQDIYTNVVLRRAKQKALAILKYMDRTEQELILKLKQAEYTESIISEIITYIKKYHYIDDLRYAINYVRSKKNTKSKRQIYGELIQKGVEKENIEEAFGEEYEDEDTALQKAIKKKTHDINNLTEEEKVKLVSSLYRKGFQLDSIKKYLNSTEEA